MWVTWPMSHAVLCWNCWVAVIPTVNLCKKSCFPGAAFSKVPRKILGKLLILGATDTQVATSYSGYSATVEHCTNRPISSVQWSNRKLCSSTSSKIRSFPNIFLGTFENAAPGVFKACSRKRLKNHMQQWKCLVSVRLTGWLSLDRPSRAVKHCNEYVCLSVCLSVCLHNSKTNSVHVVCGRGSVLLWRCCDSYVLPVLWMTSSFHTVEPSQYNTLTCTRSCNETKPEFLFQSCYFAPVGLQSIVRSVSVCLSVCASISPLT